jgi:hypothetical protein
MPNSALFVHTEHGGVLRRMQEQADDGSRFLFTNCESLEAM